jgi:hypothetical protein
MAVEEQLRAIGFDHVGKFTCGSKVEAFRITIVMNAPGVADASEINGDGMTAEVSCGVLQRSHHMVEAIPAVFGVWMGNHHDCACWILLRADNIGLNTDSIKGF